jgi:hypothetical protein
MFFLARVYYEHTAGATDGMPALFIVNHAIPV